MKYPADVAPAARVFLLGNESVYPGWYLQHYVKGELMTTRLEISKSVDSWAAATEAAGLVGCEPGQVQVGGAPWPKRLVMA